MLVRDRKDLRRENGRVQPSVNSDCRDRDARRHLYDREQRVMGSDSDLKVMSKAAAMLDKLEISYEMTIISAHREPDVFFEWAKAAEGKGIKVIIAGYGTDNRLLTHPLSFL